MDSILRDVEWLRRLAVRLARSDAEADDLTQRTWLAALRWRGRRGVGAAPVTRGWLFGILRNEARMTGREEARRRDVELGTAADGPAHTVSAADELGDAEERLALQRAVLAAIDDLEGDQRKVIILRYLEGLSVAEIARRTGAPTRTVETRLRRARERLRVRLDRVHGSRGAWLPLALPLLDRPEAAAGAAAGTVATTALFAMKLNTSLLVGLGIVAVLTGIYLAKKPLPEDDVPIGASRAAALPEPAAEKTVVAQGSTSEGRAAMAEAVTAHVEPTVPSSAGAVFVEGRVFAEDGSPLTRAPVRWSLAGESSQAGDASEGADERQFPITGVVESDIEGRIQLPFAGKSLSLAPEQSNSVALVERGLLSDHESGDLAPFLVIAPATTFTAKFVDEEGMPVAGASCSVEVPEEFATRLAIPISMADIAKWSATSEPSGQVEILGVPASGDVELQVSADGFVSRRWDQLPDAAEGGSAANGLELVLERVPAERLVRGVILGPSGDPVEDAVIGFGLDQDRTGVDGVFEFTIDSEDGSGRGPKEISAAAKGLRPVVERRP